MNFSQLMRCAGTAAAATLLATSCTSDDSAEGVDGLGSAEAAVACSEHVFWGTVAARTEKVDGLHVTFRVDDWVQPASGDSRITLVADDPDENVGAPKWDTSERVLVMDGQDSPLDMLQGEEAEELAAAWDGADSSVSCADSY